METQFDIDTTKAVPTPLFDVGENVFAAQLLKKIYHSFSQPRRVSDSLNHLHYEWEQAIVSPNNKKQCEIGCTYALVRHSGENDVPDSR